MLEPPPLPCFQVGKHRRLPRAAAHAARAAAAARARPHDRARVCCVARLGRAPQPLAHEAVASSTRGHSPPYTWCQARRPPAATTSCSRGCSRGLSTRARAIRSNSAQALRASSSAACVSCAAAWPHVQEAPLAGPMLGSCASAGGEAGPVRVQPLPEVLELAASKVANSTAFDRPGMASVAEELVSRMPMACARHVYYTVSILCRRRTPGMGENGLPP